MVGPGRSPAVLASSDPSAILERRLRMTVLIISFVIGLSVVLSYNWETRGFNSDAPVTILFGILVAAMIFIGTMYTRRGHVMLFPSKPCLSCRRLIPADSNLCPYCGTRLT